MDLALVGIGLTAGAGALLASSCCVLPILIGGLGAGATVFAGLEILVDYRAALLIVSAVALVSAWVTYLIRKPACEAGCSPRRSITTAALLSVGTLLISTAAGWEPSLLRMIRVM